MSYHRSYGNHLKSYNQHDDGYHSANEWYSNRNNGQQYSLSPPPYNGYRNNYHHRNNNNYHHNNQHHHNNHNHHNNQHRGRKNRKRERGKGRRPKTPQPRERKQVNKKIRSRSQPPPKEVKNSHTKYQQEPQEIIQYLQTLHNAMEQKKSVNIRNLGLYLRKAVNGYQNAVHSRKIADDEKFIANIANEMLDPDEKGNDDIKDQQQKPDIEHKEDETESEPVGNMVYVEVDVNDGLVQFGNNIRKFVECYCQYLWKGHMNQSGGPKKKYLALSYKINKLTLNGEIFPDNVMECVNTSNTLVHSVDKNKDATEMYLDKKEQCVLLKQLCEMAEFVEDKLVDREVIKRIN